jgi:hypothetical protein
MKIIGNCGMGSPLASSRFRLGCIAFLLASTFLMSLLNAEDTKRGTTLPEETPTIVRLKVFAVKGEDGERPAEPVAECQGFVVEAEGMILTSYQQLVDSATGALHPVIKVEGLGNQSQGSLTASIIAVEPTLNFAILKIDPPKGLKASKICPREDIVVGLPVHAIAGFDGETKRYSSGLITELNSMECYQESMTATMLQAKIEIPDSSRWPRFQQQRGSGSHAYGISQTC